MLDTVLSFSCDLVRGIDRTPVRPVLMTGDKKAHTFQIAVSRSGANVDLASASVSAYFVRADGVTVPITGSVSGSKASVTLLDGCYNVPGRFQMAVKLSMGGEISTILWADGAVATSSTDTILDAENVIPSLDDLLAQIAATEKAATSANSAASSANSAASSANTAANRADAAAASIESIGAEATTLAPGSAATAVWSTVDGAKVLTIGVPQGIQGPQGPKGDPGKDGSGSVSTVNGVEPVQGNVALTASDVGALPEGGTAADAAMLGGKAPAYYLQPRNLLVNGYFRNPVNQRGKSSYSGAVYGIDRWRSWKDGSAIAIGDGYITLSGDVHHAQYIDQGVFVSGKSYTFACMKTDGTITAVSVTYPMSEEHLVDGECAVFLREGDLSYVAIYGAGEYVWAALYEGAYTADTLPPYVPKGYAAELAECQRYYNIIPYDMDDYYVNNSTSYPSIYPVSFPEMRIIPTVTLKESWNVDSAGVSVGFRTKSSLAFQAAATSGTRVAWHGKIELNADL